MIYNKISNLKEEINRNYFMKYFRFLDENKNTLKAGRLKLFIQKDFVFEFHLIDDKNEVKIYEIPYPFVLHKMKDSYVFDYRNLNLKNTISEEDIVSLMEDTTRKPSKLYNKKIHLIIE